MMVYWAVWEFQTGPYTGASEHSGHAAWTCALDSALPAWPVVSLYTR